MRPLPQPCTRWSITAPASLPGNYTVDPALQDPDDAVVRITTSTICGTDLHILKGDLPTVTEGRILGHEGIGVIDEVGAAVSAFRKGDKVLISCITSLREV